MLFRMLKRLNKGLTVGGRTVLSDWERIPGIVAGAAYADEDAFGTVFRVDNVPKSGIVQGVLTYDDDDEDIDIDFLLFGSKPTDGTDNNAYALNENAPALVAIVTNDSRYGFSGFTMASTGGVNKPYVAPQGQLWVQAIARGAITIASGTERDYRVRFYFLGDLDD